MFKSFFTVSFFISLSRILGFIRDILIARYVGVSVLSDAFFAAFRLPNFFRRVFAEGAFNSSFVPIFIEKLDTKKPHNENHDAKVFFGKYFFNFTLQPFYFCNYFTNFHAIFYENFISGILF